MMRVLDLDGREAQKLERPRRAERPSRQHGGGPVFGPASLGTGKGRLSLAFGGFPAPAVILFAAARKSRPTAS
jgi:hypothetical protein